MSGISDAQHASHPQRILICFSQDRDSGDSWMYPYKRGPPMGNPYIVGIYVLYYNPHKNPWRTQ